MTKIRAAKNTAEATVLLESYARLRGELAGIEARRTRLLARANAAADARQLPLIGLLTVIGEKLEPWWLADGKALAKGRKSIELGGCMIGSRTGKPKLAHIFETDDKAVTALRDTRYGNQTTRVKYALDKAATLKLIELKGKAGETLGQLGFSIDQDEAFFITPVEQGGTVGP